MSNCMNCGAVLPSDSIVCEYCGTRNFVDFQSFSYSDQGQSRKCSACGTMMVTIDIGQNGNVLNIEKCTNCKGMFFDTGEVELMLKIYSHDPHNINRKRLQQLCENAVNPPSRKAYLPCPVCNQLMNRKLYGKMSGVVMDICHDHGVFFEAGEIRQLIEWKRAGGQNLHNNIEANEPKKVHKKTAPMSDYNDNWDDRRGQGNIFESVIDTLFDIFD